MKLQLSQVKRRLDKPLRAATAFKQLAIWTWVMMVCAL